MEEVASEPFGLTPEQREIRDVCREFADREIRPIAAAVDEADVETPLEVWYKAAALGLTSFMLPEEVGGGGMTDCLTGCIVQEELSRGCAGIGEPHHLRRLLRRADRRARERGAAATLARADRRRAPAADRARHDRAGLRLRRRRHHDHGHATDGDAYRLRGQKTWISNGGLAEYYVVFATVEPGSRSRGITAFVVEKGDPGITFGEPMRKMGQRAIVNTEMFLEDAELPEDSRLGDEGQGFYGLMRTFDRSRITLGASRHGDRARRARVRRRVREVEREQFGKPIAEHQAVAFRLADMATRVDAARLLVHRAARRRRRRRERAEGGRDGQALRLRDGHVVHVGRRPDARRLGLLPRVPGREVDARRQARGDRGRHVRHPAPDHLAEPA